MAEINVASWLGSLVTTVAPEHTVPGDFSRLDNFLYDADGLPHSRGGRRYYGGDVYATDSVIQGLFPFARTWVGAADEFSLIGMAAGKVNRLVDQGLWVDITRSDMTFEENLRPTFAVMRGWCIIAHGSSIHQGMHYWDGHGSVVKKIDGSPSSPVVAVYANRLWAIKPGTSQLYFSAYGDPSTWSEVSVDDEVGPTHRDAGWIQVEPTDGAAITALVSGFAGELLIFKDGASGGAIYRLQGYSPDTFSLTPFSKSIGAVSQHVVSMIGDGDVFFASRRGLHSLRKVQEFGDLKSSFIDNDVSDRWRSLSLAQKRRAVAIDDFTHDMWWLFYDKDGDNTNDHGLVFNYRHRNSRNNFCVSEVTFGANAGCVTSNKGTEEAFFVTGLSGRVESHHHADYRDEVGDAAISWVAKLAPILAGDAFKQKAWHSFMFTFDNWGVGEADISWHGDNREDIPDKIDLNAANQKVPSRDLFGRFLHAADAVRAMHLSNLLCGGRELVIKLSGSGGRMKLRSFKLKFSFLREEAGRND